MTLLWPCVHTCIHIDICISSYCVLQTLVVPPPPINVMSELVTSRMANIIWKAGPVLLITEYHVFLNGTLINSSVNRAVTLSDLIPFTTYIVTVTARNAIGDSEMSEALVFTTMEEGNTIILFK